jgi:hypothetical protein
MMHDLMTPIDYLPVRGLSLPDPLAAAQLELLGIQHETDDQSGCADKF